MDSDGYYDVLFFLPGNSKYATLYTTHLLYGGAWDALYLVNEQEKLANELEIKAFDAGWIPPGYR